MPRRLTFILGGARSGKSAHAQKLTAERGGRVLYVATAQAGDDDMARRIAAHRAVRPSHWHTLEAPLNVGEAIRNTPALFDIVLLDCLTLLANNVIALLPEPMTEATATAALDREIDGLLAAHRETEAHWIVVSNEVGLGIVPAYPLGRVYRDALGRANQRIAAVADEVLFMVAGLPLKVKG